jgi:beta-lactamase class A
MITISDNGCGVALGDILGWGGQNASLRSNGYTGTNLATPQQTSARDVATLFERVYRGTLNSPNANAAFLGLLKNQQVNNRLPLGLPGGTVFAHKTGDLDGYLHDAGIVYGPKTDYLVVVMGSPGVTYNQFVPLSQQLWNYFQQ